VATYRGDVGQLWRVGRPDRDLGTISAWECDIILDLLQRCGPLPPVHQRTAALMGVSWTVHFDTQERVRPQQRVWVRLSLPTAANAQKVISGLARVMSVDGGSRVGIEGLSAPDLSWDGGPKVFPPPQNSPIRLIRHSPKPYKPPSPPKPPRPPSPSQA
jgi:hypothetical protein